MTCKGNFDECPIFYEKTIGRNLFASDVTGETELRCPSVTINKKKWYENVNTSEKQTKEYKVIRKGIILYDRRKKEQICKKEHFTLGGAE